MIEEEKIIKRVLNGETEMFRHLVSDYHERVFILCRGFVHQIQDAEDVTQETFLQAFVSLGDFKGNSEFSTWLYRIAVNSSFTFLRKRKRRSIITYYETKISNLAEMILFHKSDENPHEILMGKQTEEVIFKEIDKLSSKQRTAFVLCRLEDMSQKEIAEVMSLSVHAVESLIQRAKKQLKIKLISIINENKF